MQQTMDVPPAPLPKVAYDQPKDWNGLILVGEAPGAEEARQGRPFVGRSGKLLNEMLEKAGIERARCLVANVFRFQPPGNKVDHFFISRRAAAQQGLGIAEELGKFGSAWCRADYAGEVAHLAKAIAAARTERPPFIMALGRTPLWALTGENRLLDKVGQRLDCRLSSGVPVIPTFHPSFILRGNWAKQPEWLEHFKIAVNAVARK